jgi:hypothetical protein
VKGKNAKTRPKIFGGSRFDFGRYRKLRALMHRGKIGAIHVGCKLETPSKLLWAALPRLPEGPDRKGVPSPEVIREKGADH